MNEEIALTRLVINRYNEQTGSSHTIDEFKMIALYSRATDGYCLEFRHNVPDSTLRIRVYCTMSKVTHITDYVLCDDDINPDGIITPIFVAELQVGPDYMDTYSEYIAKLDNLFRADGLIITEDSNLPISDETNVYEIALEVS